MLEQVIQNRNVDEVGDTYTKSALMKQNISKKRLTNPNLHVSAAYDCCAAYVVQLKQPPIPTLKAPLQLLIENMLHIWN